MKKLMILGASYSQVPLIEAARRMGIYTIVASTPGDWPGFALADEAAYVDISAPDAVLEAARKAKIDGIATCCLDTGVPAIGVVCEELGLAGLSADAARKASNKYLMKEAFCRGGVSCARHVCIHNKEELETAMEELAFPLIVKAVDLMGSRGIYRCDTAGEVRQNFEKTMQETRKDYCLLEEFIEGTLFGAEAMMRGGELVYCMLDNTEAFPGHVPTPVGHSIPFEREEELGEQARTQVRRAIDALGLDNCPVNCDLLYKDGKVYVIELTGRAGATCLPEMVGLRYGFNYYEVLVRLALGMEVRELFEGAAGAKACLSHTFCSQESGRIRRIVNTNAPQEGIVDLAFNVKPGDLVRRYENGRDRLGQVILTAPTLPDCRRKLEKILSGIKIELEAQQ